jgi:hypothetical protein
MRLTAGKRYFPLDPEGLVHGAFGSTTRIKFVTFCGRRLDIRSKQSKEQTIQCLTCLARQPR